MKVMKRLLDTIGILPPAVALVLFVGLGAPTLGSLVFDYDPSLSDSHRTVYVRGSVPAAWLDGLASLRDGDAATALGQLTIAESQCGVAPPQLLRTRLHAALAAGDVVDAELTVEKLAMREGDEALRAFVVGFAEYTRCVRTGLAAQQPGADPTAFDRAIRHATAAALAFRAAGIAAEGGDWPAARRNAERASIHRTELRRKKEQVERDRQREQDQEQEPDPDEVQEIEQELRLDEDLGLLSAAELQALLQRLARAREEKRGVRGAARSVRSANVEQDW